MGLIAPFFFCQIFIKKTKMWIGNIVIKDFLKEVDLKSGKYNPVNPYNAFSEPSDPSKIIKNLGGDDAGSAKARSEYLRSKIEDNFSKLGIPSYDLATYMKKQGIFTKILLEKYTKPFDFVFTKEDGEKLSGKALYNKELSEKFDTIVLDFKRESEDEEDINEEVEVQKTPTIQIKFVDKKELQRPFLAKKDFWRKYNESFALEGLQTNSVFTVEILGLGSKPKETDKPKGPEDDKGPETEGQKSNFYKGKDLEEVNDKLKNIKEKAKFFAIIKNYLDDPDFQRMFLESIISETKSIQVNGKPILSTLKDLKNYGLLDEKIKKKGKNRKLITFKKNLQNFMADVFSLFAKVSKNGKESETYAVIKQFYNRLYKIGLKGQGNISEQERRILIKKLSSSFSVFLTAMTKLPEMVKGSGGGTKKGRDIKVKNVPKASINTVEYYINKIADSILKEDQEKNKTEDKGSNIIKIEINKIGIFSDLEKGLDSGSNKIENEFIKCKVDLSFEDDSDVSFFDKATQKQIEDGLRQGKFFVRMTHRPKAKDLLIFSINNKSDGSGAFFTIAGNNIKSKRDPKQWKGSVTVGNKAMGNKDFKGSKATISSFNLLSK